MSPSPELSPKPPKASLAAQPPSEKQAVKEPEPPASGQGTDSSLTESENPDDSEANPAETPILRRPPVRPVRPQVSAPSDSTIKAGSPTPQMDSKLSKPELASPASVPAVANGDPAADNELAIQAALRQMPIPPPSEPKQYRAIGLVRGRYSSSEEEFTRGSLLSPDGIIFNSVLLGRVMSLVRNHVDLEKDHLWVVYPRTREGEEDLHLQIVGIWEPETLKRQDENEESDSDAGQADSGEPVTPESLTDPGLADGYFSIRGEIVFYAPEEEHVVVKIQQAPRKSSQKAKAFKLSLKGTLESTKTVGYFWDFQVQLESSLLGISEGTCIGLVPPRKKQPGESDRPRRPFSGGRGGGSRGGRPGGGGSYSPRPAGRREPVAKPVKRSSEQPSEG